MAPESGSASSRLDANRSLGSWPSGLRKLPVGQHPRPVQYMEGPLERDPVIRPGPNVKRNARVDGLEVQKLLAEAQSPPSCAQGRGQRRGALLSPSHEFGSAPRSSLGGPTGCLRCCNSRALQPLQQAVAQSRQLHHRVLRLTLVAVAEKGARVRLLAVLAGIYLRHRVQIQRCPHLLQRSRNALRHIRPGFAPSHPPA